MIPEKVLSDSPSALPKAKDIVKVLYYCQLNYVLPKFLC